MPPPLFPPPTHHHETTKCQKPFGSSGLATSSCNQVHYATQPIKLWCAVATKSQKRPNQPSQGSRGLATTSSHNHFHQHLQKPWGMVATSPQNWQHHWQAWLPSTYWHLRVSPPIHITPAIGGTVLWKCGTMCFGPLLQKSIPWGQDDEPDSEGQLWCPGQATANGSLRARPMGRHSEGASSCKLSSNIGGTTCCFTEDAFSNWQWGFPGYPTELWFQIVSRWLSW